MTVCDVSISRRSELLKDRILKQMKGTSGQCLDLSTLFDDTGRTIPMHPMTIAALRSGNLDALKFMQIDLEFALRLVNDRGNTMLHIAAAAGHASIVSYLIEEYPDLLVKSNLMGEVALHVAAGAGHIAVVEALVSFINDVSGNDPGAAKKIYFAKNRNQDNALHAALKGKHMMVASCLVCAEQRLSFVANRDGLSPLYLAVEAGQADLVKRMWQHSNNGASSRSNLASKLGGRSIVHAAVKAKRKDILAAILSEDETLIKLRDEGRTSLSFGAAIGYYEGFCYLLSKEKGSVFVSDDDGLFPIHMAAKYGHVKILQEILLCCPEALELLDYHGKNILHLAAKNGKAEIIKFVLRCYSNNNKEKLINEQDVDGNTPLHLATKNWHPKVVSVLTWDNRVNLETTNHNGATALDIAEENMDSSYKFFERLTWMALISAGAPRGCKLVLSTRVADNLTSGKYKDVVNTLLLVATLVATMTFTAGLTLPGGFNGSVPNLGMAALAKKKAFQVFLVFDTLAMYCSMITIVALIWAQLGDLSLIMKAFNVALPLLGIALTSMAIAFMAGTYAVVSHLPLLAYFILGTGLIFILILLLVIIPYVYPHYPTQPFLRHIFYYPYLLLLLAAGDNINTD